MLKDAKLSVDSILLAFLRQPCAGLPFFAKEAMRGTRLIGFRRGFPGTLYTAPNTVRHGNGRFAGTANRNPISPGPSWRKLNKIKLTWLCVHIIRTNGLGGPFKSSVPFLQGTHSGLGYPLRLSNSADDRSFIWWNLQEINTYFRLTWHADNLTTSSP